MLQHFLFSLNATLPVFAIMLLGWLLRRWGLLDQEFCRVSQRFVFTAALPAMLFRQITSMDLSQLLDGKFLLFAAIVNTVPPMIIWVLAHKLLPDKREVGAFVQGSFRGNIALLGPVLIQNICGVDNYTPLIVLIGVPLSNLISVAVLSLEADGGSHMDRKALGKAAGNIVKNPIILGILLGLPFVFFSIPIPAVCDKTLSLLANMASPMALLLIGADFRMEAFLQKKNSTLLATAVKLLALPAVTLPVAVALGFRNDALVGLLILSGTPAATASFIMAKAMGNDGVLANGIVACSTLLSAFTVTGWVFVLRSLGLI